MNLLSGLEGGAIDEVLERILSVKEGHAGLALDVWSAKVSAGGKLSKEMERQLTRRRTAHSAISTLLRALDEEGEIKQFDGPPKLEDIEENMLVEFSAALSFHRTPVPSEREGDKRRAEAQKWYLFWRKEQPTKALSELGSTCVGFAADERESSDNERLVLALDTEYLVIDDPDEFSRRATIIAQVEGKPRAGEVVVIRAVGDDVKAVIESETDPSAEGDEASNTRVILKPLCIYKASDLPTEVRQPAEVESTLEGSNQKDSDADERG